VNIQKIPDENMRMEALRELAKTIGAGTVNTKFVGAITRELENGTETKYLQNPISESELVQNINDSLQTATTIEMCRISSNNLIVSFFMTLVALGATFAAWFAIFSSSHSNTKKDEHNVIRYNSE
jgi:hypothetical protein